MGQEALGAAEVELSDLLTRVAQVDADVRRWRAMDLASVVESCFGERLIIDDVDDATVDRWAERLRGHFCVPPLSCPLERDETEACFYLLEGGAPVGTVRLAAPSYSGPWLFVHSLYVLPEHRRRGCASRLLARAAEAAARQGLQGVRLGTSWTWQESLRFYAAQGFQVYMWKHDLQLVLLPGSRPRFETHADEARLELRDPDDQLQASLTARRDGDRLVLEPFETDDIELAHRAPGTLALHLALAGWPLVRSEAEWARRYDWSDAGQPEGLAYKIGAFERVAREAGWRVDTVEIPGLARWLAWGDGEEHGRVRQLLEDIDLALRERGWTIEAEEREAVTNARPWEMTAILQAAVRARSLDAWREALSKMCVRPRRGVRRPAPYASGPPSSRPASS